MKISAVKRDSPICQLTLLAQAPPQHQNRLFIALLRIGRAGGKARLVRPVASFTLQLKSQINLAIWKKEIAVEECNSPHTNRS